jgi:WhiB family transcriptional regulator, redox-sensing transcriptional regulator
MPAPDSRAGWWSHAACSTSDPELFFPISSSGPAVTQVRRAKAICARCEIQQPCFEYALAAGSIQGIWGGTTEEERRLLSNGNTGAASPRLVRPAAPKSLDDRASRLKYTNRLMSQPAPGWLSRFPVQ